MPSYDVFVVQLLEEAVERFLAELDVLTFPKDDIFVTHNSEDKLIVYTSRAMKAYIPKKYDGWPVEFVESQGGELQLDIDSPIDFPI